MDHVKKQEYGIYTVANFWIFLPFDFGVFRLPLDLPYTLTQA